VDDTYLHGRFSGKLLIVVAFDTYNRILSLAYTLVKEENNVNGDVLTTYSMSHYK
jgi:hypothetical protein